MVLLLPHLLLWPSSSAFNHKPSLAHSNSSIGFNKHHKLICIGYAYCWVKDPWKSLSFAAKYVIVVATLDAIAAYFYNWFLWPLYWVAQGTMFWALFVLGHDSGHESFYDSPTLNSVVRHALHSFILVPYHGCGHVHPTSSCSCNNHSRNSLMAVRLECQCTFDADSLAITKVVAESCAR